MSDRVNIADIYHRGARACFGERPCVPPEVLMASVRLLAQIDRGDVTLRLIPAGVIGCARAWIEIAGWTIAVVMQTGTVPLVRVSASDQSGEWRIDREPIDERLIRAARMAAEVMGGT